MLENSSFPLETLENTFQGKLRASSDIVLPITGLKLVH